MPLGEGGQQREIGVAGGLGLRSGRRVLAEVVDVLVRPETVTVKPAPPATPSRVRSVLFFGTKRLTTDRLTGARSMTSRTAVARERPSREERSRSRGSTIPL